MPTCLGDSEIEQLALGEGPAEWRRAAEEHLQACSTCQAALEGRRQDAGLFREIQRALHEAGTVPAAASEGAPAGPMDRSEPGLPRIEGYEIQSEIHRGGQGVVYRAVQKSTQRQVALKVLLRGALATGEERRRFEREINLAANLRHPNLITVYDSGISQEQPYCAMELVDGKPLQDYLKATGAGKEQSLSRQDLRWRLILFQRICAAVCYAHQNGVIHRDLKPGNILVDAEGQPHLLDFGLARPAVSDSRWADLTRSGEFLGTLAYAAPEQARGDSLGMDVRTDVYALGVILYEMLTGAYPYRVDGPLSDVLRNIQDQSPAPPSTMAAGIDGDLETITLKALAKEPDRRYQSADHLHRDIQHYLAGEPIDARRDSTWYLLRKSLRRHRGVVAAVAAVFLIVLTALVVSLAFWRQASIDRDVAREAEIKANQARLAEEQQRREAEFQAYVANIAAATAALDAHDTVEARQRLERTPARLRDFEWRHLTASLDSSDKSLLGHTSYLYAIAYSPDGSRLASAGWDRKVILWSAESGQSVAEHDVPEVVRGLAFSPDDRLLAIGSWDGCVRLWDPAKNQIALTLRGPTARVMSVVFSPDGAYLAASFGVYPDPQSLNSVVIWDLASGKPLQSLPHPAFVNAVAYSPDGKQLAAAAGNDVTIWNAQTGSRLKTLTGHTSPIMALAYSKSGLLASAGGDQVIRLWDAAGEDRPRELRGHTGDVHGLAFHRDGVRLASSSRDKTVRLWNTGTGECAGVLMGHTWSVAAVAFRPDGEWLASASWDRQVKLWRVEGRRDDLLLGHRRQTPMVSFSPEGRFLASASWDQTVRLWDAATGDQREIFEGHAGPVQFVTFSPDGLLLASASWDQTIRLWEIGKGNSKTLLGHTDRVHWIAFSRDGRRLVSGSRDNTIRIWDRQTGECLRTVHGHTDHIHCVAFSPDESLLASSGHQCVKVWDTSTWRELASFPRTIVQEDYSLAFHPDGRCLAAGSSITSISIWDIPERRELARLHGHTDEVRAVAFSPDGRRLVSSSVDGTVKVWDVATRTEIAVLRGYPGRVQGIAFHPSGNVLAAGLDGGGIKLWRAAKE